MYRDEFLKGDRCEKEPPTCKADKELKGGKCDDDDEEDEEEE